MAFLCDLLFGDPQGTCAQDCSLSCGGFAVAQLFQLKAHCGGTILRKIKKIVESIEPLNQVYVQQAQRHLNELTKPLNSLGRLEELVCQYIGITERPSPELKKKIIFIFAADHGVAVDGVSAYPQEVTAQMVYNFLNGGAAINVLARHCGAEVNVVDIGVKHDFQGLSGLTHRKVRAGTANMMVGPAMTVEETAAAVQVGLDLAEDAKASGANIIATGEMGIGNTTASSALLSVLVDAEVESVTGFGTGLTSSQRQHKVEVIEKAIEINRSLLTEPISTLAALGGLEIAGICGLIIGGAANRLPVVIDGFISSVAALVSIKMNPAIKGYLFFAHCSREKGHQTLLSYLSVKPLLDLQLCLGEGTGAALAMNLVEAAVKIYTEMVTFESASISEKA